MKQGMEKRGIHDVILFMICIGSLVGSILLFIKAFDSKSLKITRSSL